MADPQDPFAKRATRLRHQAKHMRKGRRRTETLQAANAFDKFSAADRAGYEAGLRWGPEPR